MVIFEHWLVVEIQYEETGSDFAGHYCIVSTAQNLMASTSSAKIICRLASACRLYFAVRTASLRVCYSLQDLFNL